ncbi:MAG: MBOAT family protein [Clostridia bacterium]|nr:MBOAT family protein [Clostridia bacterium]
MIFSSLEFLEFFLPITLLTYFLLPPVCRNPVLFVFSIIFYGWEEPTLVALMLITLLGDWIFGALCAKYREKDKKKAKLWLVFSCVFNLGILGFFKYYNFVAHNISLLFGADVLPALNVTLPIGISFYTFQAMSYVIDVYRGDAEHAKNPVFFGTYVALFPQLIAGPVVRYKDVADQLVFRTHSVSKFASGVRRFVCGLAKKVILADTAGAAWESIRAVPDAERGALMAWLGIILFSFQIYFDFSAYSDMAIGLGRMIGFEFCENFNYPYIAESITDFWRRWHISLSTWFRDYVYIPLGGNRCKPARHVINIFTVWFLTGMWHGADWCFILWGVYYGIVLLLEKYVWGNAIKKLPAFARHVYALALVLFGWFIFEAPNMASPMGYFSSLFAGGASLGGYEALRNTVLILIMCIAATPYPARLRARLVEKNTLLVRAVDTALLLLGIIVSVAFITASDYSPFLYTNF